MLLREERFVALLKQRIFRRLSVDDLNIIAEVSKEYRFEAGEMLAHAQRHLPFLLIPVQGQLEFEDGSTCGPVEQLRYLMSSQPLEQGIISRAHAAICLCINRSHLFTIMQNCIGLSEGIMQDIVERRKADDNEH